MQNYHNWKHPDIDINAQPEGVVSQTLENITPEGKHFGTNHVSIFQNVAVIHNYYTTEQPLEKQQEISNCQAVIDIIQMAGGTNGHYCPPGSSVKVPFGNNIIVANFTCTLPHRMSFGNNSKLFMNHAFLRHDQITALANIYPDQLGRLAREIETMDMDEVLGGYTKHNNRLLCTGKTNIMPESPFQRNCISAIFVPHILGNATEAFILDNIINYLASLYPTSKLPKALEKVRYTKELLGKIHEAREIIESDIQSPLSLHKLALAVGTNENYLKAAFKHEFGISVYTYLTECRMRVARQLLLDTSLPVERIANIVGYTDPISFYGPFKRRFGVTPNLFRTAGIKRVNLL